MSRAAVKKMRRRGASCLMLAAALLLAVPCGGIIMGPGHMLVSGKRSSESAQVGKVLLRREVRREVRRGTERSGEEMMRLRGGEFDWNEIPRFVKGLLTWNRDYPKRNRWILPRNDIIYHWLINTGAGTCMFWGTFFLYAYTWPDIWLPDWDSVPETHKYQFKWGIALMLCALAGTTAGPWIEEQLGAWSDGFVMEFQLLFYLGLGLSMTPTMIHLRRARTLAIAREIDWGPGSLEFLCHPAALRNYKRTKR